MYPDNATMNGYRLKIMACMSAMDEGVANLTRALDAAGMWPNTVLFFQADVRATSPQATLTIRMHAGFTEAMANYAHRMVGTSAAAGLG